VLRADGRLYLVEHVRSEDPRVARWQDRLTRVTRWLAGQHYNRDTLGAVVDAGFTVEELERFRFTGCLAALEALIQAVARRATAPLPRG
jgi:hypothetical protein